MADFATLMADAISELHNASAFYQTAAGQVATQLPQFQNTAQTTINNYVNRAPIVSIYVDENNGVDALTGRGPEQAPYKTIDYALDNTDASVRRVVYLFSDCWLRKWRQLNQNVQFVGLIRIPSGNYGWPYSFVQRKIQFMLEATNSPRSDLGRVMPFFDVSPNGIRYTSIDLVIPVLAPGVNFPILHNLSGGQAIFENVNLTVDSASSGAVLLGKGAFQSVVSFYGTIGTNVPGKLFETVAAGANPNNIWNFRSNLTSA